MAELALHHSHAPLAEGRLRLATRVRPSNANHSFNGIMFDLQNIGIDDVLVAGLCFGGEIGNYQIFAHMEGSCLECVRDADAWKLIDEGFSNPSPNHFVEIAAPIRLSAGKIMALYVHSSLQNDRGIMYNAYRGPECGANDDLRILSGVARLGVTPFGAGGWYRQNRGFAGTVEYRRCRLTWNFRDHKRFSLEMRRAIFTMLLCHNRSDCIVSLLPYECLYHILEHLYWRDWPQDPSGNDSGDEDSIVANCTGCWKSFLRRMWYGRYRLIINED